MIFNFKLIFASVALIVGFVPYIFYLYGTWNGNIKPHILSWFTWSLLTGIGFFVSILQGGGIGAWIFELESFLCLLVVLSAFFKGEKNITRLDWLSFISAMIIAIFYIFTKNVILTAIFAATIDALGFVPTFRKSFLKPFEEQYLMYICSGLGFLLSIFALNTYNFSTLFYALILVVTNFSFVIFLYIRRKII